MRIVTINKLNRFWNKGIKPIIQSVSSKFDSNKMLNTLEEIDANTSSEYGAGALVVKELSDKINSNLLSGLVTVIEATSPSITFEGYTTGSIDISSKIPAGYRAIGIVGYNLSNAAQWSLGSITLSGNTIHYVITNVTYLSRLTGTLTCYVLCIKNN